jgi:hypothetical protein
LRRRRYDKGRTRHQSGQNSIHSHLIPPKVFFD